MTELLISQLADRAGVPATTLRFYESAGLLPAGRTPGGYRRYGEDAVRRLRFITVAKRLGLPLEEIAELLRVWADGSCGQVGDALRPRLAARIAEAEQRASELAAFTATLHQAREALAALPDRDGRCGSQCESLVPAPTAPSGAAAVPGPALARPVDQDAPGDEAGNGESVACALDGPALNERVRQWRDLLAGARREPVAGGVRLTLSSDLAARVAGLAAAELACCPFLDFRMRLADQALHVEVRAPAGAESMLTELIGSC